LQQPQNAAAGTMAAQLYEKTEGFEGWDVHRHSAAYTEVWPLEEIVYLTSDSGTVLETLEAGKTYVIGALVDHNRCKGLTHSLAAARGVQTARLPIAEHVALHGSTMLPVNHVFEIVLRFEQQAFAEGNQARWAAAVQSVIPQRKRKIGRQVTDEAVSTRTSDASVENATSWACAVSTAVGIACVGLAWQRK
jgi:tRNA (guanine9-N1)-methyltransferase